MKTTVFILSPLASLFFKLQMETEILQYAQIIYQISRFSFWHLKKQQLYIHKIHSADIFLSNHGVNCWQLRFSRLSVILDEPYGRTQQGAILHLFHSTCLNDIPREVWKRTSEICSKSSNFLTLLSHLTLSPLGIGFRHSHTFSGVPLTIPSPL